MTARCRGRVAVVFGDPDDAVIRWAEQTNRSLERAVEGLRALGESLQAPEKSKEKGRPDARHLRPDLGRRPEIISVRLT